MKIIDHFLSESEHKIIKDELLSSNFPYYFNNFVANQSDHDAFYFTHDIYLHDAPRSEFYEKLKLILNKLDIHSLIRAKVNCFPRTEKIIKYGNHVDFNFKHKGAIYYINTCNGGTYVGDKFIASKANRILLFDSSQEHSSTNCTNDKCRFNININYF